MVKIRQNSIKSKDNSPIPYPFFLLFMTELGKKIQKFDVFFHLWTSLSIGVFNCACFNSQKLNTWRGTLAEVNIEFLLFIFWAHSVIIYRISKYEIHSPTQYLCFDKNELKYSIRPFITTEYRIYVIYYSLYSFNFDFGTKTFQMIYSSSSSLSSKMKCKKSEIFLDRRYLCCCRYCCYFVLYCDCIASRE